MQLWEWNIVFPNTQFESQEMVDKVFEEIPLRPGEQYWACATQKMMMRELREKVAKKLLEQERIHSETHKANGTV